jgi:uncharacterized protein YbjT (DUF2867 family)
MKGISVRGAYSNLWGSRLIVENLVNKGVPVRALVRDVNKARKIKQLDNAEVC